MTPALLYLQRYAGAFFIAFTAHAFVVLLLHLTTGSTLLGPDQILIEPKPLRVELITLKAEVAAPTPNQSTMPNESDSEDSNEQPDEPQETPAEQLERLKREREARLDELRNRAFSDALGEEMSAEMIEAVEDVTKVYVTGIYLAVVENWSRPPSARNEMSAIVQVELFPSGELNSVGILESSGDAAFDRSAENAVRRAAPFVVPDDLALFESGFRSFKLNFKPMDLLR